MTTGMMTDPQEIRRFVRAGHAVFTLVSQVTLARFTYSVAAPTQQTDAGGYARKYTSDNRFVKLLINSDEDYAYLAWMKRDELIHGGAKACATTEARSWKALWYLWNHLLQHNAMPSQVEFWHSGHCGRCGRQLTVPESVAHGIGPECLGKVIG